MEQVKVTKQLYKKSEKPIEIMDEKGGIKKMTQIIREKSGIMEFTCDKDFYKKHLYGSPDYSLVKGKGKSNEESESESEQTESESAESPKRRNRGQQAE